MKLIRRKREPTPAQKALDILRTALRGLAAVRVARTAFKTYKFAQRLPLLIGLGAVAAGAVLAARKLRGGGDGPETETWSPSSSPAPSAPSPSSSPTASSGASNGAPAGTGAPIAAPLPATDPDPAPEPELNANPAETAATGTPPVELAEAGTPPDVPPAEDLPAAGTADAPAEGAGDTPGLSAETAGTEGLAAEGADPADADDRAVAGAETSVPGVDVPELDTEVASDAVPAPDAEPGPSDKD